MTSGELQLGKNMASAEAAPVGSREVAEVPAAVISERTHAAVAVEIQGGREPTPEQIEIIIAQLEANFRSNAKEFPHLHPKKLKWPEVEAALRAQPAMMWSLLQMDIKRCGVDVIEADDSTLFFADTIGHLPDERSNVDFHEATAMAAKWGAALLKDVEYYALQMRMVVNGRSSMDVRKIVWVENTRGGKHPSDESYGRADEAEDLDKIVVFRRHPADFKSSTTSLRCVLKVPRKPQR